MQMISSLFLKIIALDNVAAVMRAMSDITINCQPLKLENSIEEITGNIADFVSTIRLLRMS